MWRSTFVLGVDAVLGVALFRVDALILGALAGDREVAAYTVGYRLMETVLFVTWAVSRSLFPAMVRAGGGRPLVQVAENALAVAAAVLTPYGLLMLLEGGQIIRLLFGSSYGAESTTSLQWLAFAPLAFALNYFCGYVLFVRGRKSWLLLGTVFALLVNVALNVLLIPMFEARGAAFATTASYLVEGVLNIVLVARCAGLFRLHRSLLLSVGACVPMAAALLLLDAPLGVEVAAGGLLYVLAYMLLVRWRDPGQLALLRSLVTRS
jgi:O-antigen/teichoic acid export membrane protein